MKGIDINSDWIKEAIEEKLKVLTSHFKNVIIIIENANKKRSNKYYSKCRSVE